VIVIDIAKKWMGTFLISRFVRQIRFKILSAIVTLMFVVFVIAWVYKMFDSHDRGYEIYTTSAQEVGSSSSAHKKVFAEEEEKREALLESQRQEKEFTKTKLKKQMSNECQFWKLQKKMGKSAVAGAKINQYCNVNIRASQQKL